MWTKSVAAEFAIAGVGRFGVRCAATLTMLFVGSASASAQEGLEYRGTQDQQIFRFCPSQIPDVDRQPNCGMFCTRKVSADQCLNRTDLLGRRTIGGTIAALHRRSPVAPSGAARRV
jgi:hypothetical protein